MDDPARRPPARPVDPRARRGVAWAASIRALDQPPVLIGHSYGGLFVELLLDRGLARAGVAMSPAPPKGILVLPFSAEGLRRHGLVTLALGSPRTRS